MKKSVRKNDKVLDYVLRHPEKNTYCVYVNGVRLGTVTKTPRPKSKNATWNIRTVHPLRYSSRSPFFILNGFETRQAAIDAVLKLNGFELV